MGKRLATAVEEFNKKIHQHDVRHTQMVVEDLPELLTWNQRIAEATLQAQNETNRLLAIQCNLLEGIASR